MIGVRRVGWCVLLTGHHLWCNPDSRECLTVAYFIGGAGLIELLRWSVQDWVRCTVGTASVRFPLYSGMDRDVLGFDVEA